MKSTLHISKQALQKNFRAVQATAGRDAVVLAVVKADAYGHGAALCAPVLAEAGATWFGVSDVAEGDSDYMSQDELNNVEHFHKRRIHSVKWVYYHALVPFPSSRSSIVRGDGEIISLA